MRHIIGVFLTVFLMGVSTHSYSSHDADHAAEAKHANERAILLLQLEKGMLVYAMAHETSMYRTLNGKRHDSISDWTLASALEGYPPSMDYMPVIYSEGIGVDIDYAEALAWMYAEVETLTANGKDSKGAKRRLTEYEIAFSAQERRTAVKRGKELFQKIGKDEDSFFFNLFN